MFLNCSHLLPVTHLNTLPYFMQYWQHLVYNLQCTPDILCITVLSCQPTFSTQFFQ